MEGLLEKIIFKIEKDELAKQCRYREKVYKRMFIYNLLYGHDFGVTEIGRLFGRNHASIINALNKYNDLISMKDKCFLTIISGYAEFFEQHDVNNLRYSIKYDLRNATSSRDLTIMRKRLENDLYIDIKKNGNGGK